MSEKLLFLSSLEENERASAIDILLPGIQIFLEDVLNKECLTCDVQSIRENYVSILNCTPSQESKDTLRKRVENLKKQKQVEEEGKKASSKLGQVREKKLINIRQFKVNQKKLLGGKMSDATVVSTTDDEERMVGGDHFVEISKSEKDLLCNNLSKLTTTTTTTAKDIAINGSYLLLKNNDGLRRRWCIIEDGVLKCCKRHNHTAVVHEVNLKDGNYSAIQGRLGNMYAISLSNSNGSFLFATGNSELCTSWLISFNEAGVHVQDDLLRCSNVAMNKQNNNNNKVSWSFQSTRKSSEDVFRSDLLEALELIERSSRAAHILPKRTSYSFKELDVLKKLKASLVAKRTENKLNRRKTWSAGSFPNLAIIERFRKANSVTENDVSPSEKIYQNDVTNDPQETLPELLTSSGVVKNEKEGKEDMDLKLSMEHVHEDLPHTAQDEPSFVKSMPEGLNEPQCDPVRSSLPHSSIIAQSVPDLLLRPPSMDMSSKTGRRGSKTTITRVMSSKASSVKNAIITGLRRKGRRGGSGGGRVTIDWQQAEIYGALYRKKGSSWKKRWCVVYQSTMYAFRDSSYHHEEFRCDLHKLIALRSGNSAGRNHTFKIVRRKGDEITLAAENKEELERWMTVLQKTMTKPNLLGVSSRSSSLTPSYMSCDTYQDSSAAEDILTDQEKSESNYCETTDKDSSDEASSVSFQLKQRGIGDRGYMYHLVREDTWEHCWVEVIFGVLSIYESEKKEAVLQRERLALCDLKSKEVDGEQLYSFCLKREERPAIYLEVDNETDFQRWLKCFSSWLTKQEDREDADVTNIDVSQRDFIPKPTQHIYDEVTPNTSDSDSCYLETTEMNRETGERPLRRAMTNVLQQLTPPVVRRRYKSSAGVLETQCKSGAVKTSFLYFKANSGLWVKYWCILESFAIYCYNSPEEPNASFSVNIQGCDIRRTSHKDKNYTFEVFDRAQNKHFEFAGETTYIMYSWMRVLKIHAGLINNKKDHTTSDNTGCGDVNQPISSIPTEATVTSEETNVEVPIMDETTMNKEQEEDMTSCVTSQPVMSPKRSKTKITSLDEVLKLLHEKTLQQQLQNKDQDSSNRAKLKWKHAMLVALRKTRSQSTVSETSVKRRPSDSCIATEYDEKSAKVKSHEIAQKYDHLLDDERLKMLRRETLLKKRRNSLILRKDILERKLGKNVDATGKNQAKKRYSKVDSKTSDAVKQLSKSDVNEVKKQLDSIKHELESIHCNIQTNLQEQKKIGEELNEQKLKELHELRLTVERSPQHSKSNLQEHYSLANRRQHSDSTLTFDKTSWETTSRKLSGSEAEKLKVTQTSIITREDLRKTMSFSTPNRLVTTKSSPLLRTQTLDNALSRPTIKSRSSQEAMSLALSQIEDFEQFVQDF